MSYDVGAVAGGLLAIFLLSRLLWWSAKRWPRSYGKAITLDLLAFLVAVLIASIGMADGGPLAVGAAFTTYLIPFIIVLAVDLFRVRRAIA